MKLIVFDLDGTLIDAFAEIADAANYILEANGLPRMTTEQVKPLVGQGARVLVERILGTDDPVVVEPNMMKLVKYYESKKETTATFYPKVLETLERLRAAGIKTAVVSNKPHIVTHKVLKAMGGEHLFDAIYGESERFPRKPSPEIMRHVLQEAGVTREEALMVGDTNIDAEFAAAAGVPMVGVSYGQMSEAELRARGVDRVIAGFEELLPMIVPAA